jgi:hypothetical protein
MVSFQDFSNIFSHRSDAGRIIKEVRKSLLQALAKFPIETNEPTDHLKDSLFDRLGLAFVAMMIIIKNFRQQAPFYIADSKQS